MTQVISPTPGRIVWYHPAPNENLPRIGSDPLAAIVAAVWDDRRVNLTVFDANGNPQARSSVHLVQPGDGEDRPSGAYAAWMPYQISAAGIAPAPAAETAGAQPNGAAEGGPQGGAE
jgi:hypothetical protein